ASSSVTARRRPPPSARWRPTCARPAPSPSSSWSRPRMRRSCPSRSSWPTPTDRTVSRSEGQDTPLLLTVRWAGSAGGALGRRLDLQQVPVLVGADARVGTAEGGVAFALVGEQHTRLELAGQRLSPLVRRGRVTGGTHHED